MSGSPMTFEVKGADAMFRRLQGLKADLTRKAMAALYQEANAIMRDAKGSYVPRDRGALVNSGTVDLPRVRGREIEVELFFGGVAAPYALSVHEHPSGNSPLSWRGKGVQDILSVRGRKPWTDAPGGGRGPKYLERPLHAAMAGMVGRLQARIFAGGGNP